MAWHQCASIRPANSRRWPTHCCALEDDWRSFIHRKSGRPGYLDGWYGCTKWEREKWVWRAIDHMASNVMSRIYVQKARTRLAWFRPCCLTLFLPWSFCTEKHKITLDFHSQKWTECEIHSKWFCTSLVKSLTLTLISPSQVFSSSSQGSNPHSVLFRHASHWKIHKRDESRQTLAILSPKRRNSYSHFKRPSILLAQDCQDCKWPGKAS